MKGLDGSFSHPVLGPDQTLASGVDGVGRQGPVEAEDLSEAFGVSVLEVAWKSSLTKFRPAAFARVTKTWYLLNLQHLEFKPANLSLNPVLLERLTASAHPCNQTYN